MITYDLFDADGALVGNATDVVQNFQPGQKWKFKMIILEESTKKFRLSGMDAE